MRKKLLVIICALGGFIGITPGASWADSTVTYDCSWLGPIEYAELQLDPTLGGPSAGFVGDLPPSGSYDLSLVPGLVEGTEYNWAISCWTVADGSYGNSDTGSLVYSPGVAFPDDGGFDADGFLDLFVHYMMDIVVPIVFALLLLGLLVKFASRWFQRGATSIGPSGGYYPGMSSTERYYAEQEWSAWEDGEH